MKQDQLLLLLPEGKAAEAQRLMGPRQAEAVVVVVVVCYIPSSDLTLRDHADEQG